MRLIVDAQIFPDDLLPPEGPERERVMKYARALVEYVPDYQSSDGELVARALLETSPDVVGDHWLDPFVPLGRAWIELAKQLNCFNHRAFCTVAGVTRSSSRTFILDEDEERVERPRPGRVIRGVPAYTIPLSIEVPPRSSARRPPSPPSHDRLLRPGDAADPSLQALAAHLAPRIARLPRGAARLTIAPVLAPLFAMVASVTAIMNETSRVKGGDSVYRDDVLSACLDGLELGKHRRTAERILLRDDAEHLHVDAWTVAPSTDLPERMAPPGMREGLGMFVHNAKGELAKVRREDRCRHRPRVVYALAGPEPR